MPPRSPRTGVKRLLVVLGLLVGVLLMHGVAADHEMATAPSFAMTTSNHDAASTPPANDPDQAAAADPSGIVLATMATHPMAATCVAILAGGLLLPLLTGFRLKRRNTDFRLRSPAAAPSTPEAIQLRELTPPSLTRLCVCRT